MDPVAPGKPPPTAPQLQQLQVGDLLNADLKLTGVLGEGGTAIVYSAFHSVLRREVAVKLCSVQGRHAPEAQARLICEGKMCASIRDPRIPRVYGLDLLEDGTPYLVMEKVEGEALTRTLSRWRVPVRYACEMLCDLLDTLDNVHRAGLIHRDIKPSNLLVNLRPEASHRMYLIDFGVGKVVRTDSDDPAVTQHGMLVGTPHYMAPEQVEGCADARSDLYSAGVVLYEMLTTRMPFEGTSVLEVLASVMRDPVPPLAMVRPGLPELLVRVVEKAVARKPAERFESARAMRIAMTAATEDVVRLGAIPDFEALARTTSARDSDAEVDDAVGVHTLVARPAAHKGGPPPARVTRTLFP